MDQVQCPKCQAVIQLSDRIYGRKFRCKCGIKMRMPNAPLDAIIAEPKSSPIKSPKSSTLPQPSDSASASKPPEPSRSPDSSGSCSSPEQLEQPIRFQCPGCFMMMKVPPQMAGYVSRCTCGIKVRIPDKAAPAPLPRMPRFRLPFVRPSVRPRFLPNVAPKFRAIQPVAWDEEDEKYWQPPKSLPAFDDKRDANISAGTMGMAFAMILFAICYAMGFEIGFVYFFIGMLFLVGFVSLILGLVRF